MKKGAKILIGVAVLGIAGYVVYRLVKPKEEQQKASIKTKTRTIKKVRPPKIR